MIVAVELSLEKQIRKCCVVLSALESGEGGVGMDSLRDLPRVKKTLRQLLGDLKKVEQLSQMTR